MSDKAKDASPSPRKEFAVFEAAISTIISAYALGIEVATLALECVALADRQRAFREGQAVLTAYDAPHLDCAAYYIPGTDVGNQPGGVGSQSLWHVLNVITLWFVILSELPYPGLMDAWAGWAGPLGPESGVAYTGALQLLIASGILATPQDTLGPSVFHGLRFYGAGFPLLAIGVLNIAIGWYFGKRIRPMRDQAAYRGSTNKAQNAEDARKALVKGLAEIYAMHVPTARWLHGLGPAAALAPEYDPVRLFQAIAWWSTGVGAVGIAGELVQIYYDAQALENRFRAFEIGQDVLREYDLSYSPCAPYWIPSTDLPSQIAGLGTGMAFHAWNLLFLIFITLEEMPLPGLIVKARRDVGRASAEVDQWDDWIQAFGVDRGCWYAGWLMALIGWSWLGQPTNVLGDLDVAWLRFIAGWFLLGTGVWVILTGLWYKKARRSRAAKTRIKRGQVKTGGDKANPKEKVKLAWKAFLAQLDTSASIWSNGGGS